MLQLALILAQTSQQPQSPGGIPPIYIGLILMLVVFYAIMLSGNRKQKRQQQEMLNNVKRNDRVMTIGGILGTVVGVDGNEITLKIDESANVKIRVIRGAIQKVLTEGETPAEVKQQ